MLRLVSFRGGACFLPVRGIFHWNNRFRFAYITRISCGKQVRREEELFFMMTTKDDLGYEVIVPSFYLPWHVRGWQVLSLVTTSSHTIVTTEFAKSTNQPIRMVQAEQTSCVGPNLFGLLGELKVRLIVQPTTYPPDQNYRSDIH